jgi:hypothetical protein
MHCRNGESKWIAVPALGIMLPISPGKPWAEATLWTLDRLRTSDLPENSGAAMADGFRATWAARRELGWIRKSLQ